MIRSLLLMMYIATFSVGGKSQNITNPPRIFLSDSTRATFPQDSSVVVCEKDVPLVFNATGCPTSQVYWKYFDEVRGIRVDTLSPNVEIYATTTLYVSCSDEEPYSPNQPGANIYAVVQSVPGKPTLTLSNSSVVQCLTDERLFINANCNAEFTTPI